MHSSMPATDSVWPAGGVSRSTTESPICCTSQRSMRTHSPLGHDHAPVRRQSLTASCTPCASRAGRSMCTSRSAPSRSIRSLLIAISSGPRPPPLYARRQRCQGTFARPVLPTGVASALGARPPRRTAASTRSPYTGSDTADRRVRARTDAVRRPSVQIDTRQYADATVAAPNGRIDHRSAGGFESALAPLVADAAARRGALVIDFAAVDCISSVGLRALMVASRQLNAAQALLAVAALRSVVAEIFAISRFDKVLTVCATLDDALALCSAAALAAWQDDGGEPCRRCASGARA